MIAKQMMEIDKLLQKNNYRNEMIKLRMAIVNATSLDVKIKLLKEAYAKAKEIGSLCYIEGYGIYGFQNIKDHVLECEKVIPKEYILENKPKFIETYKNISDIKDEEELLNALVFQARKRLLDVINMVLYRKLSLEQCDLSNYCLNASKIVKEICAQNNIPCEIIKLEPGYIFRSQLYGNFGNHVFNIVILNHKKFIVDLTYSQFFTIGRNIIERLGIPEIPSPNIGLFMTMSDNRKKVAKKILSDGYILITDEVLKDYLDGFTIFYRNGLYYESTNDFSYTTNYSVSDYQNFLKGKDSQVNHEDISWLGFQKRSLKNPHLDFNKR